MDEEKRKKVLKVGEETESRQWFKEMDSVEVFVVDGHWKTRSGTYYYKTRRLYVAGDDSIGEIRETLLHELAHHIEWRHAEGFIRNRGVVHSRNFYTILKRIHENIPLREVVKDLYSYFISPRGAWKWKDKKKKNELEFVRRGGE